MPTIIQSKGREWSAEVMIAKAYKMNCGSCGSSMLEHKKDVFPTWTRSIWVMEETKILHNWNLLLIQLSFTDTISVKYNFMSFCLLCKGDISANIILKVKERRWSAEEVLATTIIEVHARNYLAFNLMCCINVIVSWIYYLLLVLPSRLKHIPIIETLNK